MARKRIAGRCLAFCSAFSILLACVALYARADKITLGLHFKTGQKFNLMSVMESDLTQTVMGQDMSVSQSMGMGYTYEVQQVADDGTATLKVTYNTVQVSMSMAGNSTQYDSTKPAASVPDAVKPFAALVGESFSMRINPRGHVSDVKGVEAIYQKILKEAVFPDESMRAAMEQQLGGQFGADAIGEAMEQTIGALFPDKPVDTGDSWTKESTVSRPYPMKLASTCTLKDRKAGIAVIEIVSKISTNPAGKPMQMGPITMAFNLSGERKGQLEIDEATGWTVNARYTQQFSGTVSAEGGPQGTMSFPITGKTTIRTESKK